MPTLDLPESDLKCLKVLLENYTPEAEVWAYGSRVSGESHKASDLDIVLRNPTDLTQPQNQLTTLKEAISESNIPILVDVLDWAQLPKHFYAEIEKQYVVIRGEGGVGSMTEEIISIIGDFVELQRGTTYKGSLVGNPGPALLGLGSIAPNGGFREESYKTYGGDCPQKLMVSPGELYVSLKDVTQSANLLGAVARVPKYIGQGRLTQDTVKLVFKNKSIRFSYLYWLLQTPQYRAYCKGRSMGTTNLSLSREDFLSYPIPKFSAAREVLVEILNEVEEKIELNCKQNRSLEAIAQALFKHWFVDFEFPDPQGQPYKSNGGAMQSSELGEIPVGWEVKALSDITTYLRRGITPSYLEDGGIAVLNQKCIRDGRVNMGPSRRHDPKVRKVEGRETRSGDVLVNSTGVGTLGRVAQIIALEEPMVVDSHVTVVRADPKVISKEYLGVHLRLKEREIEYMAEGSTGQTELSRAKLGELPVFVPEGRIDRLFSEVVVEINDKRMLIWKESKILSNLRDTLLPKLMSGELRVAR